MREEIELEQESNRKQEVDKDKETAELKSLMEVIPDEKVERGGDYIVILNVRKGNKGGYKLRQSSTLLMGISNEHQLKFNSIKDAKSLLQAIEKSSEVLRSTLIGFKAYQLQLEILGERNKQRIDYMKLGIEFFISLRLMNQRRDRLEVVDGYANNEGKEILEEHWKKAYCEWAPRNQENRNRENAIRVVPVGDKKYFQCFCSCDGLGNFMPPKPDLSFSSLEEFVNEHIVSEPAVKKLVVETSKAKASADKPKTVRKNNGTPIIEDVGKNKSKGQRTAKQKVKVLLSKRSKSTEVKGSYFETKLIARTSNIPKVILKLYQAGANCSQLGLLTQNEIICSFFAQQGIYGPQTHVEQDDWCIEFDAEQCTLDQDGLDDFAWRSKNKRYFQKAEGTEILGYQMSLESLEVMLFKTHEKNEYAWGDKYEQMEYDLKIRDLKLEEKQKELDQALKERDDFKVKLEKWSNASVLQNEVLNKQRYVSDKSYISKVKGLQSSTSTYSQSAIDRNKVIIEDWVDSDDEETDVSESQKETAFNSENSENTSFENKGNPEEDLKDYAIIDSGCSGSMTGDKDKLSDFKEFKGGYVGFLEMTKINECLILSPKFKFVDEDLGDYFELLERIGCIRLDLKNIIPLGNHLFVARQQRCDHGTEFKNHLMNEFCAKKGIKREYSIARTPKQNGVAERKNRTLIEAARTMLAGSLLPIQFWAEAINTACYVLNRVSVTKPQMKTPYEILMGRSPNISFMRPFGCPLTILNTLDHLGKFDGKSEEGYLLGYSTNSKGFRVYNRVTRKVQDCLHVNFLENQENQKGKGPDWMFDLELLTPSMNYIPVRKENYADSGGNVSTHDDVDDLDDQQFIVHGPNIHAAQNKPSEERTADKEVPLSSDEQALHDELVSLMHQESLAKLHNDAQRNAFEEEKKRIALDKGKECVDSTFTLSTANTPPQSTGNTPTDSDDDIPKDGVFSTNSFDAEEGGVADYNNMDPTIDVPSTPTLRIHKIHPQSQIIGKSTAGVQTRRKLQDSTSNQHQALLSFIYKQNRTNHKDQQTCLFACFLSQEEPKKVSQALADESWVEAMQEELLQFKLQEVWVLCDLPEGKRVIGTKWVFRNKRDERGTIIKNKARLVAQGYRQEEGVDYDEVFAPVARIEAIRLFLAFASFMGFIVYQMDVKSAFLYGNITEEVYVKQPPGFEDPAHPNKVYRVVKALYGLHQAPRAWYERLSTFLLKHGYRRGAIDKTLFIKKDRRDIMLVQVYVDDIIFGSTKSSMVKDFEDLMQKEFKMSSMGELTFFLGLQVKQSNGGIFLSQDKYVKDILNKFDFRTIKPASTPIEAHKSLGKDEEGEDVDVHLYRSMIGCLMYLTASRPDIMFAVCLCARFQVTPKVSHLHAVKRIFRYLKHQPNLGLWYPKDSPFHLEAFSDSDYAGDNHDRRSTSGGCQYLGRRLVSWQCKKQTIVAISSTEAEYVAAASCCAQVLWMQNQLLDYGFNFMNTEIHIDNESTICIVKNPVFHSKTKHIQIRHHFIRDCYEQRLINVVKVHTDDNVADLLTKGFDLARDYWPTRGNLTNCPVSLKSFISPQWKYLVDEFTLTALSQEHFMGTIWDKHASALVENFRRLKKQTSFSSKQILKLKAKLEEIVPNLTSLWYKYKLFGRESKLKKQINARKKHKKQVSSVKLGRNKDEGILSEEHKVQEEDLAHPFFDDTADQDAAVTP
ncbi:zinc finger, CCHC-type containing protein [Tanacetum coccineum]